MLFEAGVSQFLTLIDTLRNGGKEIDVPNSKLAELKSVRYNTLLQI